MQRAHSAQLRLLAQAPAGISSTALRTCMPRACPAARPGIPSGNMRTGLLLQQAAFSPACRRRSVQHRPGTRRPAAFSSMEESRDESMDDEAISSSSEQPGDGSSSSSSSSSSGSSNLLELPLLAVSALAHVNNQYIRMRRRRKWWKRLGGYPMVPTERTQLPEPAVQLWQKVLPLGLVFFCASFNLTILQNLKDAIMVTAGGAETLPFLASFCVLPASLLFFVMYGRMVTHLPERAVFYAAVAPLLAFYTFFATVLFPAAPSLHPLAAMNEWMVHTPTGLHGLLKVVGNWTYSLFFCLAELWGSVVISVLFWSLANEVCTVDEAKSVYPFMAIGANIAMVAAGCYIRVINAGIGAASQLVGLRMLVGTVLVMSCVMFGSKAWIDSRILAPMAAEADAADKPVAGVKKVKKKKKGSLSSSLEVLKSSAKIRNLALLVMSYGVGHRLFEFAWKGQLRSMYPSVQAYQSILADVATYTGMLTLVSMVGSRLVFQYLGWGVAATVSPVVMGITGAAFFGCSLLAQAPGLTATTAIAVAAAGTTAGVVTQVFARASKFSLFDPAKEMVYIEMDRDEKSQGKAAVDLVGSQIGKSGASWLTQAFLLLMGSLSAALPFIAACFAVVIGVWINATLSLHRQMQETERLRLLGLSATTSSDSSSATSSSSSSSPVPGPAEALEHISPDSKGMDGTSKHTSDWVPQAHSSATSDVSAEAAAAAAAAATTHTGAEPQVELKLNGVLTGASEWASKQSLNGSSSSSSSNDAHAVSALNEGNGPAAASQGSHHKHH